MEDYISFTVPGYEPEYFYRVYEFVTTFGADEGKHEPFSHEEHFQGYDLLACRNAAYEYYQQRSNGLDNSSYHLPFASPQEFQFGKHAAVSIILSFVEIDSDGEEIEWPLAGDEEKAMNESRQLEVAVLLEKGFLTS